MNERETECLGYALHWAINAYVDDPRVNAACENLTRVLTEASRFKKFDEIFVGVKLEHVPPRLVEIAREGGGKE